MGKANVPPAPKHLLFQILSLTLLSLLSPNNSESNLSLYKIEATGLDSECQVAALPLVLCPFPFLQLYLRSDAIFWSLVLLVLQNFRNGPSSPYSIHPSLQNSSYSHSNVFEFMSKLTHTLFSSNIFAIIFLFKPFLSRSIECLFYLCFSVSLCVQPLLSIITDPIISLRPSIAYSKSCTSPNLKSRSLFQDVMTTWR